MGYEGSAVLQDLFPNDDCGLRPKPGLVFGLETGGGDSQRRTVGCNLDVFLLEALARGMHTTV